MSYDTIEEHIAKKAIAQLKKDINKAFEPVHQLLNCSPKTITIGNDMFASVVLSKIMEATTAAYRDKYINNARRAFLETVERLVQEVDELRSEMSE